MGQHSGEFNSEYLGSGPNIVSAVNEFGKHNFCVQVLQYAETKEELNLLERRYIRILDSRNPNIGYNVHPGGTGGDNTLGWSEQRRIKYRVLQHNLTMSGITPLLKYCSKPGKLNGMYGKIRTEQEKLNISKARKGKGCGFTHNRNRVAVNKDGKTLKVPKDKVEEFIAKGWLLGFANDVTKKCLGRRWVTNNIHEVLVGESEVSQYIEKGYKFGRLKSNWER